jgi:hypothetical protein
MQSIITAQNQLDGVNRSPTGHAEPGDSGSGDTSDVIALSEQLQREMVSEELFPAHTGFTNAFILEHILEEMH